MIKYSLLAALVLASACGGDDGNPMNTVDGNMNTIDSPPAAQTVNISGTATSRDATGGMPLAGVTIAAYASTDENTPVAMATTDASGNYMLTIMTNGTALDGYLKATTSGYVDTYLYPPAPITADFSGAAINMVTQDTFDLLANTLCRANQTAANGTIAVEVVDAAGATGGGATVASSPAASTYCYNKNGLPSSTATETATDGVAYMFNVTGQATVSAMKTGSTFASHGVKARAGALTTTLIGP